MWKDLLAALLLLSLGGVAHAQEDCSKALIKATMSANSTEVTNLSMAWQLSESAYDEAKKNAGVSAVVYGVPVKATYGEFRKSIRQRAEALRLDRFELRSFAYATSGLDANSLAAYRACLLSKGGLELVAGTPRTNSHVVWIVYNPPIDASPQKGRIVETTNVAASSAATLEREISQTTFGRVDLQFTVVPRNPNEESSVDLRVGNRSVSLILPPLKSGPAVRPITAVKGSRGFRWENHEAQLEILGRGTPGRAWVPPGITPKETVCLSANEGWLLVRKRIQLMAEGTDSCYAICPEDSTSANPRAMPFGAGSCRGAELERQICFAIRLSTNKGQGCNVTYTITGEETNQRQD